MAQIPCHAVVIGEVRKDAGQAIGRSGDGGVDGIIKEDWLGLDVVQIQAKRWRETVGRPTIQAFAGSLEGYRAKKGVLITTSQFLQEAKTYVNGIEQKIVLIDGEQLVQLMMDHGVGTSDVSPALLFMANWSKTSVPSCASMSVTARFSIPGQVRCRFLTIARPCMESNPAL